MKTKMIATGIAAAALGMAASLGADRDRPATWTRADSPSLSRAALETCDIETERVPLPPELLESSGIARDARGGLWTHNDGDEGRLYRITEGGRVERTIALDGVSLSDVEDIDIAPCPGGGECVWIADTGDNDGDRDEVRVLLLPLQSAGAGREVYALRLRYPDGRHDAEAMAVLPRGEVLLVTKGRRGPVSLYRARSAARADGPVTLERLAELGPQPDGDGAWVTGAGASEDGAWVAIRTYETLRLHRSDALLAGSPTPAVEFDLRGLGESQGEGVDVASDGSVWLTSEGEGGATPLLSRLRCALPG